MRLIDLDEFAELSRRWVPDLSTVEEATNENDIWDLGYLECLKVLDVCHVYENVIPIEFIEEQIAKTTDINNKEELDVLYAGNLGYLIKLWEKENETVSV